MVYASATKTTRKKVRIPDLMQMKGQKKISSITCYDATFARLVEQSPMDWVLVGDSLGHVMQGHSTTLVVTAEDIAYHTKCVTRILQTPLVVSDMPFASAGFSDEVCWKSAELLMRSGAEAVKIEGASTEICRQISQLTRNGIPVVGHIGLTPQSVHALGGYRIQGKDEAARLRLLDEARRLEDAGVCMIVFELVTPAVATEITQAVHVPTIGIGAGLGCDGQILVLQDMLGMNLGFRPKFLKHYAQLEQVVTEALGAYCREVQEGSFPLSETPTP